MQQNKIHFGRLKFMYWYTVIGAGGFGLGIIFSPDLVRALLKMPAQDPITFGITGGVYLAFAISSIFGLKSPLKFVPVLFLQLLYKIIWVIGVVLPLFFTGQTPLYAVLILIIFLSYILGDLLSIPFGYLFARDDDIE